jgi:DedD protein
MTNLIKQRVVGLLLVLIAGIVFLPDLLDGQKEQTKEQFKKAPARPQSEVSPIVTDFPTEEVLNTIKKAPQVIEIKADDESEVTQDMSSKKEPEIKSAASIETKLKDDAELAKKLASEKAKLVSAETNQGKPKQPLEKMEKVVKPVQASFEKNAWILQLGSFKHKKNVDALEKRLTDAGFKVFIKPVQTKSGLLSKVFVGPELERKSLEKAQKTLKELTGLDGKITQFDPIN